MPDANVSRCRKALRLAIPLCVLLAVVWAGCATTGPDELAASGEIGQSGEKVDFMAAIATAELETFAETFGESDAERVRSLIAAGADVNVMNPFGATPLMYAAHRNLPTIASILLEAGAHVDAGEREIGVTALTYAVQEGNTEVVRLLVEAGAGLELADDQGRTPLWLAARAGYEQIVDLLLAAGANPTTPRNDGMTPQQIAGAYGHREISRTLMFAVSSRQAGDAREIGDSADGGLALIQAAKEGDLETVRNLLADRRIVHAIDTNGLSALHWAVVGTVSEIVEELLMAGADPNMAGPGGATPLCGAASYGSETIVRMLLDAGADANISRDDGTTPLGLAAFAGNVSAVELLIGAGADLDAQNVDGWTALTCAAWFGDLSSARLLLDAGADPLIPKNDGLIPAEVAESRENHEVANLLRTAGAR